MKRILAVLMITLGIGSVFANVTTSEKEATNRNQRITGNSSRSLIL